MLGAGGPHTERALTQLKEMLQLFLKQYVRVRACFGF